MNVCVCVCMCVCVCVCMCVCVCSSHFGIFVLVIFRPSDPLTQEQQAEIAGGGHFPFFRDGENHGALYVCDEDGKWKKLHLCPNHKQGIWVFMPFDHENPCLQFGTLN